MERGKGSRAVEFFVRFSLPNVDLYEGTCGGEEWWLDVVRYFCLPVLFGKLENLLTRFLQAGVESRH